MPAGRWWCPRASAVAQLHWLLPAGPWPCRPRPTASIRRARRTPLRVFLIPYRCQVVRVLCASQGTSCGPWRGCRSAPCRRGATAPRAGSRCGIHQSHRRSRKPLSNAWVGGEVVRGLLADPLAPLPARDGTRGAVHQLLVADAVDGLRTRADRWCRGLDVGLEGAAGARDDLYGGQFGGCRAETRGLQVSRVRRSGRSFAPQVTCNEGARCPRPAGLPGPRPGSSCCRDRPQVIVLADRVDGV